MDQARYYPGTFDLNQLASQLAWQFQTRGYQTQSFGMGNQMVVQIRKGGEAAKLFGAQAALTAMLTQHPSGVLVTLGQQKWGDKALAAGVGALILWPLAITAAVGAVRQSNLPTEVFGMLDVLVLQQNATAYPAPVPPQLMAQVMGMYQPAPPAYQPAPPQPGFPPQPPPQPGFPPPPPPPMPAAPGSAPQQTLCPSCQRPNNAEAIFCQFCATPLMGSMPAGDMAPPPPPPPPPGYEPTLRPAPHLEPTERVGSAPGTLSGTLTLPSGRNVTLTGQETVIGRGPASGPDAVDVDLSNEPERASVSRRHAKIVRGASGFEVEDLNSANQTRLNSEPLTPGRRASLRGGDVLEFGKVRCVFQAQ
ncbi:MAG TPA: FHA domain-containing protein [Ktedonobacterales bacterium]|jgi:hypothetical protein